MAFQTVFKRYELKYLITREQYARITAAVRERMSPDAWGVSTVRNVYFDTDTHLLIRRSMEHPVYKEKLRVRSYARATPDTTVFAELKKKYRGVVYKRRLALSEREAMSFLAGGAPPLDTQITRELSYACALYGTLRPTVFLSYEREAFYAPDGSDFRVTFDENILARTTALSLCEDVHGTPLLPDGYVLMELKCAGGIPLWMVELLSREGIRKTSFSKYGSAYARLIFHKKEITYA